MGAIPLKKSSRKSPKFTHLKLTTVNKRGVVQMVVPTSKPKNKTIKLTKKALDSFLIEEFDKSEIPVSRQFECDRRLRAVRNSRGLSLAVQINFNRQRHYCTFGQYPDLSIREFKAAASDYIAEIVNRRLSPYGGLTLAQLMADVVEPYSREYHKDSHTFLNRVNVLVKRYSNDQVHNFEAHKIVSTLNWLRTSVTEPTLARYRAAFSKFFSLAIDYNLTNVNPCKRIPKPKENPPRTRVLSPAELAAFIEGALKYSNPVVALSVLLCLFTGQRQGNVRAIELSWISDDLSTITFPDTKSGRPLTVYTSTIAQEIINMALPYSDGKYLFPGAKPDTHIGKPTRFIEAMRKYVTKQTGVTEYWRAHDLRHNWASMQSQVSDDLALVQETLGHADLNTTRIYINPNKDRLTQSSNDTSKALLGCDSLAQFIKNHEE